MRFQIFLLIILVNAVVLVNVPFGNDVTAQEFYKAQSSSDVYVRGYTRKNGTYVKPHYRSRPNSSIRDNWSTKGNTNPYTGRQGTRNLNQNRGTFGNRQPSNSLIENYYRR